MADERAEENGSDPKQDAQSETQAEKKPSLLERYPIVRYVLIAALAAGIIAAIVWYMNYRASGQYLQSTNNAYVRADFVTVSPKVGGYVERVLVADNQHVRRGQLLAILDPRDYRANVDQAQAQIAAAGANITTARRTLDEQRATVAQAAAQVASAEAAAA